MQPVMLSLHYMKTIIYYYYSLYLQFETVLLLVFTSRKPTTEGILENLTNLHLTRSTLKIALNGVTVV